MSRRNVNSSNCDRPRAAPAFPVPKRGGERQFLAILIVEAEARFLHAEPFDTFDKAAPIGASAKLTVGNDLEPDVLLHPDGGADRRVLRGSKTLLVEFAGVKSAKRLPQWRRAQQAADVIGAKRRICIEDLAWFPRGDPAGKASSTRILLAATTLS